MRARKIVGRILLILAIVIVVIVAIAFFMFRKELITLGSLQQKSTGVYTMTYCGDYGFDEFLKVGAKSDKDIETFVTKRLLKGLPIEINVTGAGCTCFVSKNEESRFCLF